MLREAICTAHWSRLRVRRPVFRIGLCRNCFCGKPICRDEDAPPLRRKCGIQGCCRRINRGNANGICSFHRAKGFIPEKERRKVAAATRRWRQANKEKVAAATRRWYERNKEKVAAANRRRK